MPAKKRPPGRSAFEKTPDARSSAFLDLLTPSEVRRVRPLRAELPQAEIDAWDAFCEQHNLDPVDARTAALQQYRQRVEEESA
jgi:hypothetical protein